MPRPICVKCQKFMRVKKNGILIEELMPVSGEWKPYKIWYADLWHCLHCGFEMVDGFGRSAIAQHFMPIYQEYQKDPRIVARVEDC